MVSPLYWQLLIRIQTEEIKKNKTKLENKSNKSNK